MSSLAIGKKEKRTVAVLLCGALLVVLNQMLVSNALPAIMADMDVDATTVQWLTSAYALTEAVMIPLSAWFMGRLRTRVLFIGAMALFTFGILVDVIAPNFVLLLVGRILQASATGVLMVLVIALILLIFPRDMRGQAMGLVGLVIGFAPAVGPSISGLLVDVVGWRLLFVIVFVCALSIIVAAASTLKNYDKFAHTHFDVVSVILSSIGLASLLYGLSTFASTENIVLTVVFMIIGVIFIVLFARRQLALDEPMLRLSILKSRRYRTSVIVIAALEAVLIGSGVLMPLYVQGVLCQSATVSGLIVLPGSLAGAFISLAAGRIYDRFGVRKVSVVGSLLVFMSGIGMLLFQVDSSLVLVICVLFVFNACMQPLITPINTWGVNSLDNDAVQHATAVTNTMNQVGGSFGTALIMSFSAIGIAQAAGAQGTALLYAGYHLSFIVAAALLGIAMLGVFIFVRDRQGERSVSTVSAPSLVASDPTRSVTAVMDQHPLTIPAAATVGQATDLFAKSGASGAPVVGEDGTVVGFVSNSDILRMLGHDAYTMTGAVSGFTVMQAFDDGSLRRHIASLLTRNVEEIATKHVISISPDVSFEVACQTLSERRIKELPVIDDTGKLLGVVRRRNLMAAISNLLDIARAEQQAA